MIIEQPYYLFGLLLIPLLIWLYIRYRAWRKKVLQQFGEWILVSQLIPGDSRIRPVMKFILPVLAFIVIIIGLSNVQYGSASRTIRHEGIDLAIVLDVSNSMLAEDVTPNRLEAAKKFASEIIEQSPDARIALITFAGIPVLQTPLTIDHTAAQLILSTVNVDDVPEQGSDIGAALLEAIRALPENQQHYRAIVLISDGEDQEGTLEEALDAVAQEQIAVCTAGVGTEKGTTIPIVMDGRTTNKLDQAGNAVITSFQTAVLNAIASRSNGVFAHLNAEGGDALNKIISRLEGINKNQFDEQLLVQYESQFRWFLIPALLLLLLDLFVSSKNSVRSKKSSLK